MIRCISLSKEERGKGAAASVQTIIKNCWDEYRLVIFASPPTSTERTRVGRDGDVGRGTDTGDGSDVLTDPEPVSYTHLTLKTNREV